MPPRVRCAVLVALVLGAVAPAGAGVGDKDVPLLNGTVRARVVYTLAGVIHAGTSVVTSISCTSTEKEGGAVTTVGIEFFSNSGSAVNDVAAGEGVVELSPGATKTISTGDTLVFFDDAVVTAGNFKGSARILSSSTRILCVAQLLDPTTNPPSSWVPLPVFAKTKQRGQ
jgi:hypothetical protein